MVEAGKQPNLAGWLALAVGALVALYDYLTPYMSIVRPNHNLAVSRFRRPRSMPESWHVKFARDESGVNHQNVSIVFYWQDNANEDSITCIQGGLVQAHARLCVNDLRVLVYIIVKARHAFREHDQYSQY